MADMTIRGAGVFGLSIAWAAARRGAKVRVIDPCGIGAGASGGLVGALAPHAPEGWNTIKGFQLDSLLLSPEWWARVEQAGGGGTGYGRTGRLQPISDETALSAAKARQSGAIEHWQGKAIWQVIPATGSAWEPASPTGLLIHDTLTARINPRAALNALARAIRAKGGEIVTDGADEGPTVHATGATGLAELSAALGRKIGAGQKGQAALLRHAAPDLPQIYAPGLHIVPHADGTVAIGSTSEGEWADPTATDDRLDTLITRARAALPALADAPVIARWAGLRPRAATRQPILGAFPGRSGHYIANGGFKIGFGLAPLVGEVMADLILEGTNRIPESFTPFSV